VIASEVVADRRVDGAVVVAFAVQNERKRAALRRNRCRFVAFVNTQVSSLPVKGKGGGEGLLIWRSERDGRGPTYKGEREGEGPTYKGPKGGKGGQSGRNRRGGESPKVKVSRKNTAA